MHVCVQLCVCMCACVCKCVYGCVCMCTWSTSPASAYTSHFSQSLDAGLVVKDTNWTQKPCNYIRTTKIFLHVYIHESVSAKYQLKSHFFVSSTCGITCQVARSQLLHMKNSCIQHAEFCTLIKSHAYKCV